ncbi:MAG: SDR family oxidoreductase, partial [Phycisphaerales bacterium]
RDGFDLVLTHRADRDGAMATAEDVRRMGRAADVRFLDLADLGSLSPFADACGAGAVDAMAIVASSYERTPFGSIEPEAAEREVRVNALAPLLLVQAFTERLAASRLEGGGAVVVFGDIHAAGRPRRDFAPYLMSKAALHGMVESLALELAPRVRVNAIAPGGVAWPDGTPEPERAAYESRIPLARPGTPDDAARLVRTLVRDMHYVTGSVLRLDGGRWLR